MPAIPQFQRTYLPNTASGVANTSRQTNAALENMGNAGASAAVEVLDQQQRANNATWFNEQDIQLRKRAMNEQEAFRKQNEPDPVKARDAWDGRLREMRDEMARGAPSDDARMAFLTSADRFREQQIAETADWARTTQINQFAERTDTAAQDLYNLAYRSPSLATLSDLTLKAEQSVKAGSTFMAPEKLADMHKTMKGNLARSTIEGLFTSDRAADAKALLSSGQLDGYLDSADIQKLHQQAVNAERAEKARLQAQQSRAVADASIEIGSIMDRMKKGYAIPKEDMEAAQSMVDASGDAKFKRKFQAIQQIHTFQQQLRVEGPAKLQEVVQKLNAKAYGKGPSLDPADRDAAVRMMIMEESDPKAREGVAHTILNRVASGRWGDTIRSVVTAKGQFEPYGNPETRKRMMAIDPNSEEYKAAAAIFDEAAGGKRADFTAGATHFISGSTQIALGRDMPAWTQSQKLAEAGKTQFYAPEGAVSDRVNYGNGLSEEEAVKLEVAQGILAEMQKGMKEDPISTISGLGAVNVAPVQLVPSEDGDTTPILQSLKARAQSVMAGQAIYGGQVNRVFSEAESGQIAKMLETLTPDQKLSYGTMLYQGLGAAAPMAFQQLAPKDSIFAHAAGLAEYSQNAARTILQGQEIAKNNPAYSMGSDGQINKSNEAFLSAAGTAFAMMPKHAGAVKRAADAAYIKLANDKGMTLETIDAETYKQAVSIAVGGNPSDLENTGMVTIGGGWFDGMDSRNVVLPAGINKPTFEKFINRVSQSDYEIRKVSSGGIPPMDFNGNVVKLNEALEEGVLVQVGNGAYKVQMPDGNFLRGGGPSGEFILMAKPDTIQSMLTETYITNPPAGYNSKRDNPFRM